MSHLFAAGAGTYPSSDIVHENAARTANPTDVDFGTTGASGLIVVIKATAKSSTPSVVFTIKGVLLDEDGNEVTWDILSSAAVTDVGTTVLRVSPGITTAANVAASDLVPDRVRIHAEHADSDSLTYSVHAVLTP